MNIHDISIGFLSAYADFAYAEYSQMRLQLEVMIICIRKSRIFRNKLSSTAYATDQNLHYANFSDMRGNSISSWQLEQSRHHQL